MCSIARLLVTLATGCAILGASTAAAASPRAVIFAPTGTVSDAGELDAVALQPPGSSQTWVGTEAGLWRGIDTSAGRFLAIESGVDFTLRGDGGLTQVTPLANVKIALTEERGLRPASALGLYQLSTVASASADLAYLSLTKRLALDRTFLGELTLGALVSLAPVERTTQCSEVCVFRGSFPIADSRWGLLAGWTSPSVGPSHLALEVITGTSLASGANAVVSVDASPNVHTFFGMSLSVDRRQELHPSDVVFVGLAFGATSVSIRPQSREQTASPTDSAR